MFISRLITNIKHDLKISKEANLRSKQGEEYPFKKFYVITLNEKTSGIGSFAIKCIGHINYAITRGFVPVIDMKSFDNIYKQCGEDNSWEHFFNQPCGYGLNDIKKAKRVVVSSQKDYAFKPNVSMSFLNNKFMLKTYWRTIARKYLIIRNEIENDANIFFNSMSNSGNTKILGVLARGTDYISIKPKGHPVQPTVEEIIKKIDCIIEKYNVTCIFLASEDINIINRLKNRYKDLIITYGKNHIEYCNNKYINECINNKTALEISMNYLISLIVLSKCDYLISSRTSGLVLEELLTKGHEYSYFFNLGYYK